MTHQLRYYRAAGAAGESPPEGSNEASDEEDDCGSSASRGGGCATIVPPEVYPMQIGILSPELKSIEQLFAGNARFSVPRYQRSFAWTADETEELWEDLFGAVKRSGEYF